MNPTEEVGMESEAIAALNHYLDKIIHPECGDSAIVDGSVSAQDNLTVGHLRALRALLRAQPSHQQQPGWLPIESAPKDGTWLLCLDDGFDDALSHAFVMRWEHDAWLDPDGYATWPTHWMPLPAPPTDRRVTEETK